jgi:hypothetical protein
MTKKLVTVTAATALVLTVGMEAKQITARLNAVQPCRLEALIS